MNSQITYDVHGLKEVFISISFHFDEHSYIVCLSKIEALTTFFPSECRLSSGLSSTVLLMVPAKFG